MVRSVRSAEIVCKANGCFGHRASSVFRKGGHAGIYILLKSVLKTQEMPFQRPKFQNGISNLYILLKSALKMQEMPFQRPKFQTISGGAYPRTPLQLCRYYGLSLTKILATPLHRASKIASQLTIFNDS